VVFDGEASLIVGQHAQPRVAEHPELKRGDLFELIQSWLAAADDPPQ
jgi:hypothetical protein